MKSRIIFVVLTMFLLSSIETFGRKGTAKASTEAAFSEAPSDVGFWVAYWGEPRVVLFGSEEETFNQNVREIVFPFNVYDNPSNPSILDANVQWLKDHASDRFYIEGYASSEGGLGYNLTLSQRRATWVKQTLISKGIAENRIVLGVPWGELYPVCSQPNEDCWGKNRLVRFVYSPS